MQRAQYYLLGERAVVLELAPPVTLQSQQRIWALAEKLNHHTDVREVVPGMNNLTLLLYTPQADAEAMLELLRQGWEGNESLVPESRDVDIPVIYGGEYGPDLDEVARHTGMTPQQVVECHSSTAYVVYFLGFQPGFTYLGGCRSVWPLHAVRNLVCLLLRVLWGSVAARRGSIRWSRRAVGN